MALLGLSDTAYRMSKGFDRWFPAPRLLLPRSMGVDISDSSIKWMGLSNGQIFTYGSRSIPEGIVVGGAIKDTAALGQHLREIKNQTHVEYAHAALPEEGAYVFSMHVPSRSSREQILRQVEFEFEARVPIPPSAAVFDFDVVSERDVEGTEIGVSVFPREAADSYAEAFAKSGLVLLSLELEARSIARSVSSHSIKEPITLIADFGRGRTGFALVKYGIPLFTQTVAVGGDSITNIIRKNLKMNDKEAEYFKNELGLVAPAKDHAKTVEEITPTAAALADEISRHFQYWDTRRDEHGERMTPVGKVALVGGSANLRGLADFISSRIQAPVERGNIWRNICSFEDYIPPIDRRSSLEYATAAGLALRGI